MSRSFTAIVIVLASALLLTPLRAQSEEPTALFDEQFGELWYDGQAELIGYDLQYPRYGQIREGTAVTIFVAERFNPKQMVKTDDPGGGDDFGVMKLNLVEDFPTGVYDYNMMTSTFVGIEPSGGRAAGETAKVSFSAQEWCGHAYHQLVFRDNKVNEVWHSYFEGEADGERELNAREDGLPEDALFHWARGMARPIVEPGERKEMMVLRSLAVSRLKHTDVVWEPAVLSRSATTQQVTVPAGEFEVRRAAVEVGEGQAKRTWFFYVEEAFSHRIIRWTRSDGIDARMIKSARMKYWQMNRKGQEAALKEIGLKERERRTP